jgi:two-component system sensor histidine kinase KdpD
MISGLLLGHTGAENNSALVFVLAVMLISSITTGYVYGIAASLVGGFCINYFFMYPFSSFSLDYAGYPVAMVSMVLISIIICALTSKVKSMAVEAVKKEQNAKALYEMNQRLNEEKAAIQREADRESIRSNILRAVSHDLRTPLTAISGAVSVLLASEEVQAGKNVSLLMDIKADADSLITMVENLLSVTRIQDGTIPLKKREEMLEEVAGDAVMTIHRRFPEAKVALELSEDILYLPMDPMLIKQVMVNLLENSIRHSGDTQHIRLNLFRQDEWAVVEVRDRGCGLSPEISQAIQAGRQLPQDLSSDSSRGMGIGLSVCQSIIKAHDGFFAAGNDPEGGAVFRFGLPMEEK